MFVVLASTFKSARVILSIFYSEPVIFFLSLIDCFKSPLADLDSYGKVCSGRVYNLMWGFSIGNAVLSKRLKRFKKEV